MLNNLGLDRIVLSQVDTKLLGYFLAHEPSKWAFARPQQGRLILHLLNFDLDKLLIRHCDPLILVFICGLSARLQYNLRVIHIHDLGRHILLEFLLVVLLLLVVHIFLFCEI